MDNWLKQARDEKRLTQNDVARIANIGQPYYSDIEHGKKRPSPEKAKRISEVLGIDWQRFYEDAPPAHGG